MQHSTIDTVNPSWDLSDGIYEILTFNFLLHYTILNI